MNDRAGQDFDVAVVGGGLVGAAIAWGLARAGRQVVVLDEGDVAFRASRGNFALVWVQSKGMGLPRYGVWTVRSSNAWPEFARELQQQTGIDVVHQRPGGLHLTLSPEEFAERADFMKRLLAQPGMPAYDYTMLDAAEVRRMLPHAGPEVAGGSYCSLDGHVNVLRLFRALHAGAQKMGAVYLPERPVDRIERREGGYAIGSPGGSEVRAGKVVLAAGNGNARLGPMVGLTVPVRPQRGQVIVTEKAVPFLDFPVSTVRQTDEGSVMFGDSKEEAGFDASTGSQVIAAIARRAVRMFPIVGRLNVVRSWGALRVMTPDGFPIYEQSPSCPGAFVAACHSGVTLAANHALALAPMIAAGRLDDDLSVFTTRRFDVQAAA